MPKGVTWPGLESGEVHVSGVPGLYAPGRIVPLASTGLTEKEMAERIAVANKDPHVDLQIVDLEPAKPSKGVKHDG